MIEILEPGVLTSVQDVPGRLAWRQAGVPVGGAADPWSARLANRLVGNRDDAALLEMTLRGATVRFVAAAVVALTGGLTATVDGLSMPLARARRLRAGATIDVGDGPGARGYLAVAGGIVVPRVLGSASTDLRTGFGGLEGRGLLRADRLEIGSAQGPAGWWAGAWERGPIRIVDGPHGPAAALAGRSWLVSDAPDRIGVRLQGEALEGGEAPSMGLPLGAIQVPPDGRPIIMLADRPVTGGYRVPACVIGADIGRVAQLRPGDEVAFASVSIQEAWTARRRAEGALASIEELGDSDDELRWAGSHT